jgi:TPR repeat protein
MNNLAVSYEIQKKYEKAKKYYLMAIEKGNSNSMNSLAIYYHEIEKNYDEAKKYYLMAIEKGCN